ncbi:MAG: VOC family protein [Deltaproteobacteria bacterium]|nr:VOC family protein [Deltaproteobacteria bacterium]
MKAVLDHIVLAVVDMDAMLAFYCDVIGLQAERVDAYRDGRALFPLLRLNDTSIIDLLPRTLWEMQSFGSTPQQRPGHFPNLNHFCIAVDAGQWQPLLARLTAAAVEIDSGPMTLSGARGDALAIYVLDPDGNKLEVRFYD